MYTCYEFTYAGLASSMFGLAVCDLGSKSHSDIAFGNAASIVEKRLQTRITPLHFGVNYHEEPLQFNLIFAAEESMDRYQLQEVAKWLTGYQEWLTIDQPDMENYAFKCLISNLTPVSVGWFPVAFEAQIICDCPYAYGYPFSETYKVTGSSTIQFYNDSSINENLRPMININLNAGQTSVTIKNNTTNEELTLSSLPDGITIHIDNENCILRDHDDEYNLYSGFNFVFLSFAPGLNNLTVSCSGTIEITGRFMYNVGA